MTTEAAVPATVDDPTNAAILAVSEDRVAGFQRDPLGRIAERSGIALPVVVERIQTMLQAGTSGGCGRRCSRTSWRPARSSPGGCPRSDCTRASTTSSSRIRSPATW